MTTSTTPTISLAELNEKAALQTRVDRKYALTRSEAALVLAALDAGTRVLEIDGQQVSSYESVYFDTPDLLSYRLAAHARRRRSRADASRPQYIRDPQRPRAAVGPGRDQCGRISRPADRACAGALVGLQPDVDVRTGSAGVAG